MNNHHFQPGLLKDLIHGIEATARQALRHLYPAAKNGIVLAIEKERSEGYLK